MKNITEIKDTVASQVGITYRMLDYILAAQRDPHKDVAIKLELATGIGRAVWVFGTAKQRQERFEEFANRMVEVDDEYWEATE